MRTAHALTIREGRGDMHAWEACVHEGMCARGTCAWGACMWGGHACQGGHVCPGTCMPRGLCMPGGMHDWRGVHAEGGEHAWGGMHGMHTPPVNRITDACENITFPQHRLRAVKNSHHITFICLSHLLKSVAMLTKTCVNCTTTTIQWRRAFWMPLR